MLPFNFESNMPAMFSSGVNPSLLPARVVEIRSERARQPRSARDLSNRPALWKQWLSDASRNRFSLKSQQSGGFYEGTLVLNGFEAEINTPKSDPMISGNEVNLVNQIIVKKPETKCEPVDGSLLEMEPSEHIQKKEEDFEFEYLRMLHVRSDPTFPYKYNPQCGRNHQPSRKQDRKNLKEIYRLAARLPDLVLGGKTPRERLPPKAKDIFFTIKMLSSFLSDYAVERKDPRLEYLCSIYELDYFDMIRYLYGPRRPTSYFRH